MTLCEDCNNNWLGPVEQRAKPKLRAWFKALRGPVTNGEKRLLAFWAIKTAMTVDLAPSNHLAHYAIATTRFFQKDLAAFRVAAERCIALNPMDGSTSAYLGLLMTLSGEGDRGVALVDSAMQLNPNHPGWYKLAAFANHYQKKQYQAALDATLALNLPGYYHSHAARAAALGQLGQREAGQKAVRELLALRPDFGVMARKDYSKWYRPEQVEHLIDGLRKAGLEIAEP